MVADVMANLGYDEAQPLIERINSISPAEALFLTGFLRYQKSELEQATDSFIRGFELLRTEPWVSNAVLHRVLARAVTLSSQDSTKKLGARLYEALNQPFAVYRANEQRLRTMWDISRHLDGNEFTNYTLHALQAYEPNILWDEDFLRVRSACYAKLNNPKASAARKDLATFRQSVPLDYTQSIKVKAPPPAASATPVAKAAVEAKEE
jgi:hypothetical protein